MLNRMLTQKEQFLLLFVGLAIVLGALALTIAQGKTEAVLPQAHDGSAAAARALPGKASPTSPAAKKAPSEAPVADTVEAVVATSPDAAGAPVPSSDASPSVEVVREVAPRADIAVAVMGAVEKEGLYHLRGDARVGDLLAKAGGALEEAELGDINLGAPLIDGSTLSVPRRASARVDDDGTLKMRGADRSAPPNPPEYTRAFAAQQATKPATSQSAAKGAAPSAAASRSDVGAAGALVDLNRASPAELATLPGIGPALAQRIVEYRTTTPFRSIEQLDEVPGIGPKRLEQLRPLVKVQ